MTGAEATFGGLLHTWGLTALFLSVTLEAFGLPLPGESAVIAASVAAAAGQFPILSVAAVSFTGAVLGDNIGYLIGRRLGRPAILAHGARFGLTAAALTRAEALVRRHGPVIVVGARFVVLLRQMNGIVAGTTALPWGRFLAANILGALLWVGTWTTLAWQLGPAAGAALPWLWHHLALAGAVAVPLLVGLLVTLRLIARRH